MCFLVGLFFSCLAIFSCWLLHEAAHSIGIQMMTCNQKFSIKKNRKRTPPKQQQQENIQKDKRSRGCVVLGEIWTKGCAAAGTSDTPRAGKRAADQLAPIVDIYVLVWLKKKIMLAPIL